MRSWLLLFACNLMWALQFTCIKLVQDQVGPMFTVWGPMTLSLLMLAPIVLRRRECNPDVPQRKIAWTYILLGGLGVVPAQVMMTWGTRLSLASNAAVINLTLPVATALFAVLFLRERMTRLRAASFAVAVAGVLLCSTGDLRGLSFEGKHLAGNILVLLATLGCAFYNSYGKKALEWHQPMRMLFWTYVAVCLMMAPFVLAEERSVFARIPEFTPQTWTGMALLTVFHNFLSMVLFLKALKDLDAIQAALSNYLVTFFGVAVAAVWLGEKLSSAAIAGGVLVLGGTLLITVWEELRPRAAPAGSLRAAAPDSRT
jgi:drug/metabolite transporter (DMT)-like permease